MSEEDIIAANTKLLVHGDDTEIVCQEHRVTMRWGDLDSISQLAVLAGLDVEGDVCIMRRKS